MGYKRDNDSQDLEATILNTRPGHKTKFCTCAIPLVSLFHNCLHRDTYVESRYFVIIT